MNSNIIILIIYSLILIFIIHFIIKHLLLRENIYKKIKPLNKEYFLSEKPKEFILNKGENQKKEILNIVNNGLDTDNMEKQLLEYMDKNEDIYKQKTDIYLENKEKENVSPNANLSDYSNSDFGNENMGLDEYYEKVVDISKEIQVPNQIFPKQKETKDPDIKLNTKEPNNSQQNSEITWEYKDENIMNGGEITNGIYGWDSSTYSQYASLSDNSTILPCSNN